MNQPEGTFDPYHKWLGIAPAQQPPHYYRLLGIELFEEDPEVIAAAADRQMAHVRTFQTGPHATWSQRILNELAAARLCLLDPRRKREYDAELRAQLAAETQPGDARVGATPRGVPPAQAAPQGADFAWIRLLPKAIRYLRLEAHRLWLQHSRLPGLYWQIGLALYQEGWHERTAGGLYPPLQDTIAEADRSVIRTRRSRWRTLGRLWRAGLAHRRRAMALASLGEQALAEQRSACAPPVLTESLQSVLARVSALRSELRELAQVPSGQVLSPRRLAWLVAAGMAGSATLLWSWLRPW